MKTSLKNKSQKREEREGGKEGRGGKGRGRKGRGTLRKKDELTSSPGWKYFTSSPHSITTPDTSRPRVSGNSSPLVLICKGSRFIFKAVAP